MQPRALWAGVALLGICGLAHAGPREFVADCAAHLPEDVAGLDDLEEQCPGLNAALEEAGLAPLLSDDTRDSLDAVTLRPALALMDAGAGRAPDPLAVGQVLKSLGKNVESPSLWSRFKDWVRQLLGRPQDGHTPTWLDRWLGRLTFSEAVARVLGHVLIALIIGGAIAVIVAEVRATGVLAGRRWRRARGAGRAGSIAAATPDEPSLAAVDAADRATRARVLLTLIVEALTTTGRLRGARALTHRELARAGGFADDAGRRFAGLATVAEREAYGRTPVPDADRDAAIEDGKALYRALRADARGPA